MGDPSWLPFERTGGAGRLTEWFDGILLLVVGSVAEVRVKPVTCPSLALAALV